MYSIKEKEEIIEEIKSGKDRESVMMQYGISRATADKWEKEILLRQRIEELIKQRQLDEAESEIAKLTEKNSVIAKLDFEIRVAELRGNMHKLSQLLLQKRAEENKAKPLTTIDKARIVIYGEGNIDQKALLLKQLLGKAKEKRINAKFIAAEFYSHYNLQFIRAERILEEYRKTLELSEQEEINLVEKAIETLKKIKMQENKVTKRKCPCNMSKEKWNEFWKYRDRYNYILELIKQARSTKNVAEVEKAYEIALEIDISVIKFILSNEKDNDEKKRIANIILKSNPLDEDAIDALVKIARIEGNIEGQKKLLYTLLDINPQNVKAIKALIKIARIEENIEEQKRLLNKILEIEPQNLKAINQLIEILHMQRNIVNEKNVIYKLDSERKQLLQKKLELKPKDEPTIISLMKIAREYGDVAEQKRLLYIFLEVQTRNVKIMSSLVKLIREEKESLYKKNADNQDEKEKINEKIQQLRNEEKSLLYRILEINPKNVKAISSLIKISREEGDVEKEEELLERQLVIIPDKIRAINSLMKIARNKGDNNKLQRLKHLRRQLQQKQMLKSMQQSQKDIRRNESS